MQFHNLHFMFFDLCIIGICNLASVGLRERVEGIGRVNAADLELMLIADVFLHPLACPRFVL